MKVIINADDLGFSHKVNLAIEQAILERKISSSTIMANSPLFEEAISIAKKYDSISFGVHLNIIEFAPITNLSIFQSYHLVGEDGQFIKGAIFNISVFTMELKTAIKEEWIAQIRRVINSGVRISHVDSHQHTHCIRELQDVLIDVLKEVKIYKCRTRMYSSVPRMIRERSFEKPSYHGSSTSKDINGMFYKIINHLFLLPIRHRIWLFKMTRIAQLTDDIRPYGYFVQDNRKRKLARKIKTIELECHPGLDANARETDWLMADELHKCCPHAHLINYFNL